MRAIGAKHYNVFQQLIRQWDTIHPYNAAQMMRLRAPLDFQKVEDAWQSMLDELRIGATRVIAARLGEAPGTSPSPSVQVVESSDLANYLTNELNQPFDPSGAQPLRPFVLDNRDGTFWVGVVYQHWVADSASIRVLLREWFFRMFEPEKSRRSALPIAQEGYWNKVGPLRANWSLLGGMWSALTWTARLKFCRRPAHRDVTDYSARFALHRLPAGIVPKLLEYSRSQGVTLNDVFLAAVVRICDRYIAAKPNWRKHHLAVGTIVDLRGSAPRGAFRPDESGLFLGFTSVLSRFRHRNDWRATLHAIAVQNAQQKKTCAAEASMIRIASAVVVGKIFHGENLMEWYRKRIPLCAGISNVNLNRSWVSAHQNDPIVEYVRVSPVGPMIPVVFTPSSLGDDLNFGLTYRPAVITAETAELIAREFSDQLLALASGREP